MPGILPMKVIKVGTSAQTRIAQACDRCRSKKIRCDGLRPCSQCSQVGFECKTSDKLSRRAFPRGYTESLEERVRSLENEVRELKDLLDEKDEKIDILSKMYDRSPHRKTSPRRPPSTTSNGDPSQTAAASEEQAEIFKIQQSPALLPGEQADSVYVGSASGRALVDAFKIKLQESGKQSSELTVDRLFTPLCTRQWAPQASTNDKCLYRPPPRLLSDQMITVYFQEWAPLFPVVHRPTFLALYEKYFSNPDAVQDKHSIAQLNLVFSVASLSNESRFPSNDDSYEKAWSTALDEFVTEQSMVNLQCIVLAQIYSIQRGDTGKLLHYKSLAIGIAQRLGLHLSQKRFALGALTSETRKKVFWTLYTLDCFSAAYLGLPRAFRDEDVHCEYPADLDDEYVTDKGFQPTLPGEFTRLSSALALFRLSRILARVLDSHYCCGPQQEFSFQTVASLIGDLDAWSEGLAHHLKLDFSKDKPSAQVISSRCPLLSMTYHYVRTLIHRPVVCANLGQRASSSVIAMAASSKHIIQIIQLLDERKLSFTHCLNKNDLLLLSGFGVLFQALNLEPETKLVRDNQRSVQIVVELLQRRAAPSAAEFSRFVGTTVSVSPKGKLKEIASPVNSIKAATTKSEVDSGTSTFEALAARYTLAASTQGNLNHRIDGRLGPHPSKNTNRRPAKARPQSSGGSSVSPTTQNLSMPAARNAHQNRPQVKQSSSSSTPNLDYFQFPGEARARSGPVVNGFHGVQAEGRHDSTIWEKLLSTLDENQIDNGDDFYHWSKVETMESPLSLVHSNTSTGSSVTSSMLNANETNWTSDIWANKITPIMNTPDNIPQSVFSLSDESLASGEEFHAVDARSCDQDKAFAELMISQFHPEGESPDRNEDFEILRREVTM